MTKISQLSSIGDSLAIGDQFLIRDIDDAGSPNKSVTVSGITRALADGDATAPALAFAADKNTGIYRAGTDSLAVATNGTGRLFVDASGLVGVGAAPATILDSTQSAAAVYSSWTLRNTAADGYVQQQFLVGASGANGQATVSYAPGIFFAVGPIANDTSTPIVFRNNNGSERLRITAAGLVGIGTAVPGQLLEIHGASNPAALVKNTTSNVQAYFYASATAGIFGTPTLHPLVFNVENLEKARIDTSGRLLVGTSSALTGGDAQYSLLQVVGSQVANDYAIVVIGREQAATAITSGQSIGQISFTDNGGNEFGTIKCTADANAGAGDYPGRLVFSVTADAAASPTERMRISATGRTSCFSSEDVVYSRTAAAAGTSVAVFVGNHTATNTSDGTASSIIWSNGNIVNTNNSYGSISDVKLKENIVDANSQWDDLKALQVRNYNFKEGQTHTQIGLVAQEVELVSPGLVSESPDRDAEGNDLGTVTKSVNYSVLYMKAVKALQEAMERIEILEAAVTALQQS